MTFLFSDWMSFFVFVIVVIVATPVFMGVYKGIFVLFGCSFVITPLGVRDDYKIRIKMNFDNDGCIRAVCSHKAFIGQVFWSSRRINGNGVHCCLFDETPYKNCKSTPQVEELTSAHRKVVDELISDLKNDIEITRDALKEEKENKKNKHRRHKSSTLIIPKDYDLL